MAPPKQVADKSFYLSRNGPRGIGGTQVITV